MRFVDIKGRYINLDNCIDVTYDKKEETMILVMRDSILIELNSNDAEKMDSFLKTHSDPLDRL